MAIGLAAMTVIPLHAWADAVGQALANIRKTDAELQARVEVDPAIVAARLGYVQAGTDMATIRIPGEPLEGAGRRVVSGTASIEQGDLLLIGDTRIRLQGLRAPASGDLCKTASGKEFDCGKWALEGMKIVLGKRELQCAVTEVTSSLGDPIGWCEIEVGENDRRDLGHLAVSAGVMIASDGYGGATLYRSAEDTARSERRGIWSGSIGRGCGFLQGDGSGIC